MIDVLDFFVPTFGFLGLLLGGLLGGAAAGGGLLGKMAMNRMSRGGGQQGGPRSGPDSSSASAQPQTIAQAEEKAAPVGPNETKKPAPAEQMAEARGFQKQKPAPITSQLVDKKTDTMGAPPPKPAEPKALAGLTEAAQPAKPAIEEKKESPLEGLASDAPPAPKPSDDVTVAGQNAVAQVATQTDDLTPVTPTVEGEQFGQTPEGRLTEMADQIGRQAPKKLPRMRFPYTEGNPSKQPDMPQQEYTSDQGYAFAGASSPNDMFQAPKYT